MGRIDVSCVIFILITTTTLKIIGALNDGCTTSRCGPEGPEIRFPFRTAEQPPHCGNFELACKGNKTVIDLPPEGGIAGDHHQLLTVVSINYDKQILALDPESCPVSVLLSLNLSDSLSFLPVNRSGDTRGPFTPWEFELFKVFNCSGERPVKDQGTTCFVNIHCLSGIVNHFFGVHEYERITSLDESCESVSNRAVPREVIDSLCDGNAYTPVLSWEVPDCGGRFGDKTSPLLCTDDLGGGLSKGKIIAGVITGLVVLILVMATITKVYLSRILHRNKEIDNQKKVEKFLEDYKSLNPTRYTYAEIKRMTDHFKTKLGEGGYGSVFKGLLPNGIPVAVKILKRTTINDNGEDFVNEVKTIGRIHHVNVVRLLGFCADGFRRALIYEFMKNESLEKFIFTKTAALGWEKLQDIAIGIARGIEYLHQGCDQRILHFDIKPHNILLNHNLIPKISDFGLAKLCSKEQSIVSVTAARGTVGYIAPEMFSRNFGNVSYKSDVYSFGMLLLEMVGRRKNTDATVENTSQVYFPESIYGRLQQGEEELVPSMIVGEGDDDDALHIVKKLTITAFWCIQWHPVDRPSMKSVVQMLLEQGNLTMPPNPFASADPQIIPDSCTTLPPANVYKRASLAAVPELEPMEDV